MEELNTWERDNTRKRPRGTVFDVPELDRAFKRNTGADQRLKSAFESIFEKYGQDFSGVGDEIDMRTGEIVVDNGHVDRMNRDTTGQWEVVSDEAASVISESSLASGATSDVPVQRSSISGLSWHQASTAAKAEVKSRQSLGKSPAFCHGHLTMPEQKLLSILMALNLDPESTLAFYPDRDARSLYNFWFNNKKAKPLLKLSLKAWAMAAMSETKPKEGTPSSENKQSPNCDASDEHRVWNSDENARLIRLRIMGVGFSRIKEILRGTSNQELRERFDSLVTDQPELVAKWEEEASQLSDEIVSRLVEDLALLNHPTVMELTEREEMLLTHLKDCDISLSQLASMFNYNEQLIEKSLSRTKRAQLSMVPGPTAAATPVTTTPAAKASIIGLPTRDTPVIETSAAKTPEIKTPAAKAPATKATATSTPANITSEPRVKPKRGRPSLKDSRLSLQTSSSQKSTAEITKMQPSNIADETSGESGLPDLLKSSGAAKGHDSVTVQDTDHETSLSALPSSLETPGRLRIDSPSRPRAIVLQETLDQRPRHKGRLSDLFYPKSAEKPKSAKLPQSPQKPSGLADSPNLIVLVPDDPAIPTQADAPSQSSPHNEEKRSVGRPPHTPKQSSEIRRRRKKSMLFTFRTHQKRRQTSQGLFSKATTSPLVSPTATKQAEQSFDPHEESDIEKTPSYLKPRSFKPNGRPHQQLFSSSLDSATAKRLLSSQ